MGIKIFIKRYLSEIKSMAPTFDKAISHSDEMPITAPTDEKPIYSFAVVSDTHLPDKDSAEENFRSLFKDIAGSEISLDAFLHAGDLADLGIKKEYDRFYGVLDSEKHSLKIILSMGNHDVRVRFKANLKRFSIKINEYLGIDTHGKNYYSYKTDKCKFIVLGSEKLQTEMTFLSEAQLSFLDSELLDAEKNAIPSFVLCHQPLAETHGLPEFWKTGDVGKQNDALRKILEKHKNVFYINGHLHAGLFSKVFETLSEANGVYSVNIPSYRKINNAGYCENGTGFCCFVYPHKTIFKARNFLRGKDIDGEFSQYEFTLKD